MPTSSPSCGCRPTRPFRPPCPSACHRARSLLNAVLRRIADLVAAGPVRWPDPGTKLSYPDWVLARLGEDLGPDRALAALEQMNHRRVANCPRPTAISRTPGSQAVARAHRRPAEQAPRGSSGRMRCPGRQDDIARAGAPRSWWASTWRLQGRGRSLATPIVSGSPTWL